MKMLRYPFHMTAAILAFFLLTSQAVSQNVVHKKDIEIQGRYLNLPVENGADSQRMRILWQGQVLREFDIELAATQTDFWVFTDLSGFESRELTLEISGKSAKRSQLEPIYDSQLIRGSESIYEERLRPQFHFSSRRGWNNDPNGLVFEDGVYHLFYQHNPYGWNWGNMHWGHAVSSDLVHWKELPVSIYPKNYGDWAFSGSAVIDSRNTAGFSKNGQPPLVSIYTSTGRGEVVAYSFDQGFNWQEYEGNPVIEDVNRGRDPRVFWYEPDNFWVMVLYQEEKEMNSLGNEFLRRYFYIYNSPDLKNWTYCSKIQGFYECPELFHLPVEGVLKESRWVMYGANGDYLIGQFDGRTFVQEGGKQQFATEEFYASQTYNNIPEIDGRRIQIGWGRIASPGMPFNQMMLFPTELTLRTTEDGIKLFAEPIREIESLHREKNSWNDLSLEGTRDLSKYVNSELLHVVAEFAIEDARQIGFLLNGFEIDYDILNEELNGTHLRNLSNRLFLEILVDRTSIEIFANSGRLYLPKAHLSPDHPPSFQVYSKGGSSTLSSLTVWELESIF